MKRTIWQNPNGTWSHHRHGKCEWSSYADCATDLRFANEAACVHERRYDHHRAGMLCGKCGDLQSDFL